MRVVLFPDMRAEGWKSMDRYADSLSVWLKNQPFVSPSASFRTGVQGQSSRFQVFSLEPPVRSSRVRAFYREHIYPRMAARNQGHVNHVLDHSYAHLLNFLDPRKSVVTCHDLIPLFFEKDPEILEKFKSVVRNLIKVAFIIADSESTKRDLVDKLSIPDGKIKVVYLGVDSVFRPLSAEETRKTRARYSLPNGHIIMSHGNSLVYKNIEGMFKAFREVVLADARSYFVRVGPTPLNQDQRGLIRQLGISDNFYELINPSDDDLVGLYNCADVFLSPSFKEGFGLTVLQSLACGVPVVVSKGTSLEEIAGEVGVYVDPHDTNAMARVTLSLLGRESRLLLSKERLTARASLFTWEKTAQETLEVYNKVLEGLTLEKG